MKKILLPIIVLLTITYNVNAQRIEANISPTSGNTLIVLPGIHPALTNVQHNDKTVKSCTDKNKYADSKGTGRGTVILSPTTNGLYSVAQQFPYFDGFITGFYFDGFSKNVANSINVAIYSIGWSGYPDVQLSAATLNIPAGSTPMERGGLFTNPVAVNGGFYCVVELNVLSTDSITVLMNQNGSGFGLDYAYVRGSSGYSSLLYNYSFDVDIMTRPVIKFDMEADINGSVTDVCPGGSLFFSNSSWVPSFANTKEFSPTPSASNYSWNFGDGSPVQSNPTFPHTFLPLSDPNKNYNVKASTIFYGYSGNCVVSDSMTIVQNRLPEAHFSYSSSKLNVTFKNNSKYGQSYKWDYGHNGNTSTLQAPLYSYPFPGTYTVTLEVTNPCSTTTFQSFVTVSDTADFTNGVFVASDELVDFSFYPNPAGDMLNVDMKFNEETTASIAIYNILGKKVIQLKDRKVKAETLPVDVTTLEPGSYFIQLTTVKETYTRHFQKK